MIVGTNSNGFLVKELLNPWVGLCYVIIPDPSLSLLNSHVQWMKIQFSEEIKNPEISAFFMNKEDWPGLVRPAFGLVKLFQTPLPGLETFSSVGLQKRIYKRMPSTFYLPESMTNCKNYSLEKESYMECAVKSSVDCFEEKANVPESGCACVPNITYHSYYEIHPLSLDWEECKSNTEYMKCFDIMNNCAVSSSKCALPCETVEYIGKITKGNGFHRLANKNEIIMAFHYSSVDTEIHSEVLIFDLATFIGTAGGSLGLFLGFTLTGFAEQLLDCFIRN